MSSTLKEIAKFASGAEAWHAFVHAYLWFSGTTLHVFGITETPTIHMWGAIVNSAISLLLGWFAWGKYGRRSA